MSETRYDTRCLVFFVQHLWTIYYVTGGTRTCFWHEKPQQCVAATERAMPSLYRSPEHVQISLQSVIGYYPHYASTGLKTVGREQVEKTKRRNGTNVHENKKKNRKETTIKIIFVVKKPLKNWSHVLMDKLLGISVGFFVFSSEWVVIKQSHNDNTEIITETENIGYQNPRMRRAHARAWKSISWRWAIKKKIFGRESTTAPFVF